MFRAPSVEERWFWLLLRASRLSRPSLCTIPCFMNDWVAELMACRHEEGLSIAALQCRPRHWGERSQQLLAVSVEMGLGGCVLQMEVDYLCAICANWLWCFDAGGTETGAVGNCRYGMLSPAYDCWGIFHQQPTSKSRPRTAAGIGSVWEHVAP